jgi:hypothetical protein
MESQSSLLLNAENIFSRPAWLVLNGWHGRCKWYLREKDKQDDEYHPWEIPSFSFSFLKNKEQQHGIDLAIPEEVADRLVNFENGFRLYSDKALWFVAHYQEAQE